MIERWIKSTQEKDKPKILLIESNSGTQFHLENINADFYVIKIPSDVISQKSLKLELKPKKFYKLPDNNIYPGFFDFIMALGHTEELKMANYLKSIIKAPIIFFPQSQVDLEYMDPNASDINVWRSKYEADLANKKGLRNNLVITYSILQDKILNNVRDFIFLLSRSEKEYRKVGTQLLSQPGTSFCSYFGPQNATNNEYSYVMEERQRHFARSKCVISFEEYITQDLIDAMNLGAVPIVPKSNDSIITHGVNGFEYQPRNWHELDHLISLINTNTDLHKSLSIAAVEITLNFPMKDFVDSWNNLLKAAM